MLVIDGQLLCYLYFSNLKVHLVSAKSIPSFAIVLVFSLQNRVRSGNSLELTRLVLSPWWILEFPILLNQFVERYFTLERFLE